MISKSFKNFNIEKNFNLLNDIYYVKKIEKACNLIIDCLKKKNKIIFCGNGGSASDSNHLSTELVGRYLKNRKAYPAISLSSNSSLLTALGNDYGFDKIFLRQIESIQKVMFYLQSQPRKKQKYFKNIDLAKEKELRLFY